MKTRKTIRKIVSLVLAVMMMASAFAFTASAAETKNTSLLSAFSDALVSATADPTPETPLEYSYKAQFYAKDVLGRVVDSGDFTVSFYLSKEAYDQGAEPIFSGRAYNNKNGKYVLTYSDAFSQKPPHSLYWVVRPETNIIFTPNSGTAYAQLDA